MGEVLLQYEPPTASTSTLFSGSLTNHLRLYRLSSLQPDLYRRLPLSPAPHLIPRRSRMVLHERRANRRRRGGARGC